MADLDLSGLFSEVTVDDGPDDVPEAVPDPDSPPAPDGPTCEVCGTLIEWSGRGRKPKKCAEHKTRTAGAAKAQRRKTPAKLDLLESDLTRELVGFGKNVSSVLPCLGVTLVSRSEKTAKALTRVAENNPKILAALEASTRVVPMLDLAESVLSVAIALAVDLGRLNPDSLLSVNMGVSEIWHEVHDEGGSTVTGPAQQVVSSSNGFFPGTEVPPRFERVEV